MLGSSPSVFATTLLLADAGGYSLAVELAGQDVVMGQFAGLVIGCTMGYILLFDIPVALTVMKKEDRPVLACGLSALFLANLLAPQLLAKAESAARQESGAVPAKAG